jgi:hypothetical protein
VTSSSKANRHSASFASKESPISLRTPLCDLLGIDVPIIGAPFGPWHQVELAAAVCAAAGGIADGRGLVAALAMGAQGVSMEVLRSPFLEHWAGRADELGRRASELGAGDGRSPSRRRDRAPKPRTCRRRIGTAADLPRRALRSRREFEW